MSSMELFNPGENLILTCTPEKKQPKYRFTTVRFPGRIHVTPIDCNRFDFGKPGGGGMGFAIDMDNTLLIKVAQSDAVISQSVHKPLLQHYVTLLKHIFMFDGYLEIECRVSDAMRQHSGLGSSISVATACAQGVNALFGYPLSKDQIRRIIADNFVEVCEEKLSRGLETGVGSFVVLEGGFAVIADDIVPLYHSDVMNGLPVILIYPASERPGADKPESMDMLNRTFLLDSSYRYTRAYRMIMDIVPALARRDFRAVGRVVWDYQFSGTHQSMIQSYYDGGIEIIKTMTILYKAGASIVGMSSVGPTIYAVCENYGDLLSTITSSKLSYEKTRVSQFGLDIRLEE